ncbi:MAG: hypothetical protein AYK18_10845 [Theionarchaea archaeon DG-70]|nr:MAG: hypothetical protein AYK18_10845 [Theionarchaea archaeon DG-70]
MSFLLDPPTLILLGAVVYTFSRRFHLRRLWQIIAGVGIVSAFIVVSSLLYMDLIRCYIPFVIDMKGSEWMFHSNITGIYKEDVPKVLVAIMFVIYPLWYYLGYISAQYLRRRVQIDKKVYDTSHVKSRKKPRTDAFTIKRGTEPRKLLRECLEELGGIQAFVEKGETVLIKANICGGNPERPGTFTTIEITDELSRMIWEMGAAPLVVDADMIWTELWQVASAEGYSAWADHATAHLLNLSETKLAYFDFGGLLQKEVISKELLNADVIISLPVMKTHILTGVTLGMKNMYGTLPTMDKAVYHKLGIEEVIFEVNNAFPPNLTIIDGITGGEGMGPLSSDPVNFQTLIASGNVVVADAVACTLMGFDPLDIKHINLAHEAGLGNATVEVDMKGLPPHEKDGCWLKPSVEVGAFYNELVETSLGYPYVEKFFNLIADFVFYDMATLPIFENITPEMLLVLNDILSVLQVSGKVKKQKKK